MNKSGQSSNEELRVRIKNELKFLDWTIERLAYELMENEERYLSESEEDAYPEKIKKKLQRSSTPIDWLEYVFRLVVNHEEYRKKSAISPLFVSSGEFDDDFYQELKTISDTLSENLEK